jgi:hypothetical protein
LDFQNVNSLLLALFGPPQLYYRNDSPLDEWLLSCWGCTAAERNRITDVVDDAIIEVAATGERDPERLCERVRLRLKNRRGTSPKADERPTPCPTSWLSPLFQSGRTSASIVPHLVQTMRRIRAQE